ncbi:hypothetical protein PF010_g23727 [Phytophthora fragariae]|uniref:RNase H type-1 domain-containing protein n=1 Tax=Phytophthora fragariae TaxID=53985 RepID=A0A6A3IFL7_9STRA|nr:hypothetical protein PF011_g22507 [Phytophthora fragariae]KAE9076877.1 hypothetical protein PF010_g23727 [Phytophthora fragariae]
MPAKLARVTGKIVAAGSDAETASIGDAVERMVANCWSIGAATYLLAVWRWRVAHFDALNDVSATYHTAGLRTRLRYGHMDATRDYAATVPPDIGHRLSEAICGVLGAGWEEAVNMPLGFTHAYLIAVAGSRDGKSRKCSSGILIAQIHKNTGNYRIKQVGSKRYAGANVTLLQAVHLGLLWGLRRCRSQHWEQVHILGDHPDALRQHITRRQPRARHTQGDYWKVRRSADAVGVRSWTLQDREYNRTANALAKLAHTTGHDTEWRGQALQTAGECWTGIAGFVKEDVKHWLLEHAKSTDTPVVEGTV